MDHRIFHTHTHKQGARLENLIRRQFVAIDMPYVNIYHKDVENRTLTDSKKNTLLAIFNLNKKNKTSSSLVVAVCSDSLISTIFFSSTLCSVQFCRYFGKSPITFFPFNSNSQLLQLIRDGQSVKRSIDRSIDVVVKGEKR